jgi:hypothetical protein
MPTALLFTLHLHRCPQDPFYQTIDHPRTIDQLEKLDLYQQHLDMVDLHLEKRQSEGIKRFEAALRMPVEYYWVVSPAD